MESVPPTNSPAGRVARHRKKLVVLLIALLVIEVVTLVVWSLLSPKYEYSTLNMSMFGQQEIRKNKSTGETQIWGAGKWQKIVISGDQWTLPGGTQISVGGGSPPKHTPSIPSAVLISVIVLAVVEVVLLGGLMISRSRVAFAGDAAVAPAASAISAREPEPPTAVWPTTDWVAVSPPDAPTAVSPPIDEEAVSSPNAPAAVSPPTEPTPATPPAEPTAATPPAAPTAVPLPAAPAAVPSPAAPAAVPPPAAPVRFCPGCGTAYAGDEERFCSVCGRARTESV